MRWPRAWRLIAASTIRRSAPPMPRSGWKIRMFFFRLVVVVVVVVVVLFWGVRLGGLGMAWCLCVRARGGVGAW